MVGGTVGKLDGRNVNNPLPGALRHDVHKPEQILAGVAEAYPPACARLVIRGGRLALAA